MSQLHLTINLDNDAFWGDDYAAGREAAHILRGLADRIEITHTNDLEDSDFRLRDINGNLTGLATFVIDQVDATEANWQRLDDRYRGFVKTMSTEDIRSTLVGACGIEPQEWSHIYLREVLVNCLHDDDIALEAIIEHFEGKYK